MSEHRQSDQADVRPSAEQFQREHVHDCTAPDLTCPCGYVFRVPPVSVSVEIFDGQRLVLSEGFNCETVDVVINALREYADRLESEMLHSVIDVPSPASPCAVAGRA